MSDLRNIPLSELKESKTNPRKTFFESAIAELAASIKEQGLLQPIVVRPSKKGFEIVCGARRYRASKKAGLEEIPAIVREMTNAQVLDAQIVENLQRQDVHPLEEAECIQKLLDSKLYDSPQAVADKIGRNVKFVHLRLKLNGLHKSVKKALLENEIGIGWAELASTLDQAEQAEALAQSRQYYGPKTPAALREWLRKQHTPLEYAPFDLTDAMLKPDAGACKDCPFNSDNSLIPDEEGAICSKGICFSAKLNAHVDRIIDALKKEGCEPIELSLHWYEPKRGLGKNGWNESEASDAEVGVVVDAHKPSDIGRVIRFKKPVASTNGGNSPDPEVRARRKAEIKAIKIEQRYRFRLYEAVSDALLLESNEDIWWGVTIPIGIVLRELVKHYQVQSNGGINASDLPPGVQKVRRQLTGEEKPFDAEFENLSHRNQLFYAFQAVAANECRYSDYNKAPAPVLEAFAVWLSLDTDHIRKEAETELMTAKERKAAGL